MKFILGKKKNMEQIFSDVDGKMVPVTAVAAGPCYVAQIKTAAKEGYDAVQIAFGSRRENLLTRALKNHLRLSPAKRYLREFRVVDAKAEGLTVGDKVTVSSFAVGDKVTVSGLTKGKGFQGVVKRHGFAGSPASHGHKDQLRMPGSIGATDAARVFKGVRMAGRMGGGRATVANLQIIKIDPEKNLLYVSGAVPGPRNGLLLFRSVNGKMTPLKEKKQESAPAVDRRTADSVADAKEADRPAVKTVVKKSEDKATPKNAEQPVKAEAKV